MAALPPIAQVDPTLEAADRALVEAARAVPRRAYLGMSGVGHPCGRKLWYDLNSTGRGETHDAATLKRFADGHASEAVMADRLRLVPTLTLVTADPDTGRQYGFTDLAGRFRGHMDGAVLGLIQAPATWHVWEHKCVGEKKWNELNKLKAEKGEKAALAAWDQVYYAQAVLYMHYSGMQRHYLTVATPGTRAVTSCRSNADPVAATELRDKAERILNARAPLARVSNDPSWWQCRWCEHHARCHA